MSRLQEIKPDPRLGNAALEMLIKEAHARGRLPETRETSAQKQARQRGEIEVVTLRDAPNFLMQKHMAKRRHDS
jgi:hypothetical protein